VALRQGRQTQCKKAKRRWLETTPLSRRLIGRKGSKGATKERPANGPKRNPGRITKKDPKPDKPAHNNGKKSGLERQT